MLFSDVINPGGSLKKFLSKLAVSALFLAFELSAQVQSARPAFEEFDVATIKSTAPDWKAGRFIRMEGAEFVARNHTLKTLVAAAYNLTPRIIAGGPGWIDSDHYDILAKPPGELRPNLAEQMSMLRKLLSDRFQLKFHREPKELPVYALTIAKNGPKLKELPASPDPPPALLITLAPTGASIPGRNASMGDLASVLQRAALDRPVLDRTGLSARYDFDLQWTPNESQFGGIAPGENAQSTHPDLFVAIQQQLGLRLEATRGAVRMLVIETVERPSEN